jgi:DIM1 family U5 snRNP protein
MGSVVLPHLRTGWHVDQAILSEEDRLVVIRFGRDSDPLCMQQDEILYKIADRVKNFAVSAPSLSNQNISTILKSSNMYTSRP